MNTAPVYPVMLRLAGRRCLVVGGGRVAVRKIVGLLEAGAIVDVVTRAMSAELATLVREARPAERLHLALRAFDATDVEGHVFVITATGVREVDDAVARAANDRGIFVNAADNIDACSAILPAVVRRGPVAVAVSTSGTSPALASYLRDRIGEQLSNDVGAAAEALADERRAVRESGRSTESVDWTPRIDALLGTR